MRKEQVVEALVEYLSDLEATLEEDVRVQTFKEAGVLTNDVGVVVDIGRSQFQIAVVQTK